MLMQARSAMRPAYRWAAAVFSRSSVALIDARHEFVSGTGAPVTLPATSAGIARIRFLDERCCRIFAYFRRPPVVLKNLFTAMLGAALLVWSGLAVADEYRPDQFLGLDLSKALLSPKPLGPASQFVPGPLDVNVDRGGAGAQASVEPKTEPKEPQAEPGVRQAESRFVMHKTRVAHARTEKPPRMAEPRGAARTKLARRHGNPLDAQAFDTRVQVWPCRSGGICNWKR
jgi:hypothetical protein